MTLIPPRPSLPASGGVREALGEVCAQLSQSLAENGERPILVHSEDPAVQRLVELLNVLCTRAQQSTAGLEAAVTARTLELTEARLRAERASDAKSQFLASMSHEIRTPLSSILDMNTLLLGTELSSEQQELAEAVEDSARGLLRVVNDVLDTARIEAGQAWQSLDLADFDLHELLARTVRSLSDLAREKRLTLTLDVAPDVPRTVHGDAGRLRQVLLNLLGNAVKFTHQGHVTVKAHPMRRGLRVEVHDTGIGIAPEAITRLFQKFEQADPSVARRYGGTGLGLAISKELVELMGGRIDFKSTLGVGSLFWFEVRMRHLPDPVEAASSAAPQPC